MESTMHKVTVRSDDDGDIQIEGENGDLVILHPDQVPLLIAWLERARVAALKTRAEAEAS